MLECVETFWMMHQLNSHWGPFKINNLAGKASLRSPGRKKHRRVYGKWHFAATDPRLVSVGKLQQGPVRRDDAASCSLSFFSEGQARVIPRNALIQMTEQSSKK